MDPADRVPDFAGFDDESLAVLGDEGNLLLVGNMFDPQSFGGIQRIALLKLAVSERVFSDRFELP